MTDQEWWNEITTDSEFTTPGGGKCRRATPTAEEQAGHDRVGVEGFVLMESANGGRAWVPLASVRTWKRRFIKRDWTPPQAPLPPSPHTGDLPF